MIKLKFLASVGFLALAALNLQDCDGTRIAWEALPQVESAGSDGSNGLWVSTAKGRLFYTKNSGADWSEVQVAFGNLAKFSFIDSRRGWAISNDGEVFQTADGGQTWSKIAQLRNQDSRFYTPERIRFVDELHGWAWETYSIWHTEDGGVTWDLCFTTRHDGPIQGQPRATFFLDARNAWVCTVSGGLYNSEDGGKTWYPRPLSPESVCSAVFFLNDQLGWAASWLNGAVYRTENGGKRWEQQSGSNEANSEIDSVYFADKREGWAVGRVLLQPGTLAARATVLHSRDGGRSWEPIEAGRGETFFSNVDFTDAQHGWLLGRDTVYRTDDAGRSWAVVLKLPPIKGAE